MSLFFAFHPAARAACVLGLLLASCQSGSSDKPAARALAAPPAAPATPPDSPGTWYRQYRTLLPGSPDSVTVHLQRLGTMPADEGPAPLSGFYTSANGRPLELSGTFSAAAPDSLTLRDTDPSLVDTNYNGPVWRLRREGSALVGTRAGQPIRLRLVPPQGGALVSRQFTDSIPARPNTPTDSIYGHVSLHALVPAGRPAVAATLLRGLRGDTLDTAAPPTLASLWQEQRRAFAGMYQEEVGAVLAECAADTSGYCPSATLRYQDQTSMLVLWNDDRLLSVGYFSYRYSGGAHGMYGTRVLSLDPRTGRALRYADIFRPGSEAQLEGILARYARPALGLKPGAPLSEALFEDTLPATHNVYLTRGGAMFVYGPYEVASFAQGEVRVFVPLEALRPVLKPGLPVGGGEVASR
ncbi:DUF3298 and DUF4163 domain-containing protein [Hymenobacter weizhouensis]|uniref:DUF3298 and DUF4163 domain-containing protein n=1 Tax=Hymenobacter sp. YIM 151500-1 TaxID=2987689 RepID=UPI002226E0D5|nr:DUF3298 and DUF4163 domain-containing protein [Hymenobacter sp. YIM 151500-1]UYZ63366.1 DUF3298 and DUF4163 domain-containing protein [Hymenobacter sp. YIM 151500-1]